MTDEELTELLGLVDEPVEDVPAVFERRLWDELSSTFDTASISDAEAFEASRETPRAIQFIAVDEAPADRSRWARWGSLVAAVAVVVVVGLVLVRSGSEPAVVTEPTPTPTPVVTEPTATVPRADQPADAIVDPAERPDATAPPVLRDPVEACERYRIGAAPLVDLPNALSALEPSTGADAVREVVDDIETVRLALVTYARDLESGDSIDDAGVREFTNTARTLGQAVAEMDSGDLAAALRSVEAARGAASSLLQSFDLPSLRYDPFGPSIDCVE